MYLHVHTHWTACSSFSESYILIGSMKLILQTVIFTCILIWCDYQSVECTFEWKVVMVCTLKIVWHLRNACTYTCIYMYMHLHVQYMHMYMYIDTQFSINWLRISNVLNSSFKLNGLVTFISTIDRWTKWKSRWS